MFTEMELIRDIEKDAKYLKSLLHWKNKCENSLKRARSLWHERLIDKLQDEYADLQLQYDKEKLRFQVKINHFIGV